METIISAIRLPSRSDSRRPWSPRSLGRIGLFIAAAGGLLGVWLLLAFLYGGVGGGHGVMDSAARVAALTSTNGRSGDLETSAILATSDYFHASGRSAHSLHVDPEHNVVVLVSIDTHIDELPEPAVWAQRAVLQSGGGAVKALQGFSVAFRTSHHQTVALQFPKNDPHGQPLVGSSQGTLQLSLLGLEPGAIRGAVKCFGNDAAQLRCPGEAPAVMKWTLPLAPAPTPPNGSGWGAATSLGGLLAVMAGLLVVFSPCAVHMTAYFLPLVTGLGMKEVLARKQELRFRANVAVLGLAFVSGFVLLYTTFGVAAGFAGQFFSDTTVLEPYLVPVRLVTGAVVIYLALQTLGLFRLPFVLNLQLPSHAQRAGRKQGYFAVMLAGMSVSVGCLACVGGTLLASLLLYAGTSGSPLVGGATLFLFALGSSLPFLLAAFAFDKVVPRFTAARSLLRHSATIAGAVMLVVGLLIVSGNESVFERLVLR